MKDEKSKISIFLNEEEQNKWKVNYNNKRTRDKYWKKSLYVMRELTKETTKNNQIIYDYGNVGMMMIKKIHLYLKIILIVKS